MKTFEVEVKIRNNLLKERRLALGMTQPEFAATVQISLEKYCNLECLRGSPLMVAKRDLTRCIAPDCTNAPTNPVIRRLCVEHRSEQPLSKTWREWKHAFEERQPKVWTSIAQRLAAFHNVELDELFPDAVLIIRKSRAVRKLASTEIATLFAPQPAELPAPDTLLHEVELSDQVERLLTALPDREEKVLRDRFFGERGLEETATELGVSRERVRQIENTALRRLRHPRWCSPLRPWIGREEGTPQHFDATPDEITRWCAACLTAFKGTARGPILCLTCEQTRMCPRCRAVVLACGKRSVHCRLCGWGATI